MLDEKRKKNMNKPLEKTEGEEECNNKLFKNDIGHAIYAWGNDPILGTRHSFPRNP